MMLLQYAVWGVWLPYLGNYLLASPTDGGLGFTGGQLGWILGLAGSIGAITAPFIAGQVADRFLNAEKALGLLLILGGLIKFATFYVHSFWGFLALSILYSIAYMPTLALTNSIAFAHLRDPEKQFPPVRTWGTIGWILASNAFPLLWLQTDLRAVALPPFLEGTQKANATALFADCLRVSGVLAVVYGVWAIFFLPKTPPTKNVKHPLAFVEAFALWRDPGLVILTIAALAIAMIHQVYFIRMGTFITGMGYEAKLVGPIMSIGQVSEIVVLAVLGLFLKRLGYRWVLVLGCLSYALRFTLFALATPETRSILPYATILHGLCYGFFFAGAYLYVEKVAPKDVRHSAQTVFGIVILGLGPVLAGLYNTILSDVAKESTEMQWSTVWYVQAAIGLASAVLVALAFREKITPRDELNPG